MNKIKTYTAIDFQQYHAGTMPAQDMHALEKAALEDPFLADALDGYEHTINAAVEIEAIKQKLPPYEEKEKATVIAFNKKLWTRVAASVVLFMGLGYLFFNLNSKKSSESIAKNVEKIELDIDKNKLVVNDSAILPAGTNTTEGNISQNTLKATDIVIQMEPLKNNDAFIQSTQTNTNSYTPAPSTATSSEINVAPSTYSANEVATEKKEFATFNDSNADSSTVNYKDQAKRSLRKDANVDNEVAVNRSQLFNNNAAQNGFYNNAYNFSGIVKTPAGGPMQNATIKLRNSNIVTKTDNNGRFNFVATDSVATVSVLSPGYANKDLTLSGTSLIQSNTNNNSVAGNTLNEEVVVVGFGTVAKKKAVAQNAPAVKADEFAKNSKPVELNNSLSGKVSGVKAAAKEDDKFTALWGQTKSYKIDSTSFKTANTNFKSYAAKKMVPQFDEKGIEYKGKVILSFTTNKKGAPRKIKVIQSLNKKCDAEAKRLLENGPVWLINNNGRNTVTIEF
jgi:hypothetical protein